MDISATYVWSQVLTVIEYALLGLSYLAKNRKAVVLLDIVSMTAGIIAFLLLGADLGMWMSVVVLLANFYYLWQEGQKKLTKKRYWWDYVMLFSILTVIIVLSWLTNDGWVSLFSALATALYEISIWQESTKVYKFIGIPVAISWMTYNGFIGSIAGVAMEAIMLITSIIGYVREVTAKKKTKKKNTKKKPRK